MKDKDLYEAVRLFHEKEHQNSSNYFDIFACKIKFSFDSNSYFNSLKQYKEKGAVDDYLKIIIHEYFHYFQRAYSTFGFYFQMLERYKEVLVINMAKHMLYHYQNIDGADRPVIDVIQTDSRLRSDNLINKWLFDWIDLHLINSYVNDTPEEYLAGCEYMNQIRPDFCGLFISRKYASIDKQLQAYLKGIFGGFPYRRYKTIDCSPEDKSRILHMESQSMEIKAMNMFTAKGILESYSKAAEFFLMREEISLEYLRGLSFSAKDYDYYFTLAFAAQNIPAKNSTEFLLTFLAVCDIVISPPCIPYLSMLREEYPSITDFDPGYRFYCAWEPMKRIRPIASLEEDYVRYTQELCQALGWPTPMDTAAEIVSKCGYMETSDDIMFRVFYQSQQLRLKVPYCFLEITPFLTYLYNNYPYCPLVELSDMVLINHGINDEVYFTMEYLNRQYWGNILTRTTTELMYPYHTKPYVLDNYKESFERLNEEAVGLRINNIKVVNPSY
ncbi:hypothetical protein [Anaerocolumna xylanovorans]|uniref:Uncharacterized protein n=1 Tax=Anaerocolumna xylanovorans DSM 12503 TaxID=1121345 RepID=A0A1M7Y777_9FIRM|nr:hypothetical protein [Anaerocolumna xylanovorans]SHO48368.1 hypothetical protein SAMN02745217_01796 [Anaerocolumna xylanovorans DSM 12503]